MHTDLCVSMTGPPCHRPQPTAHPHSPLPTATSHSPLPTADAHAVADADAYNHTVHEIVGNSIMGN